MSKFRITVADYRRVLTIARKSLGKPAALDEALVSTGIDAFIALLDGESIEVDGIEYQLVAVPEPLEEG